MRQLVTIPMSHYCEKVRWALEYLEIEYVERGHLQGFHYGPARWHAGGPYVPVLLTDDGAISDSTTINQSLDAGRGVLYPEGLADEVLAWEERLDEGLGVDGRRWIYHQVLDRPKSFLPIAAYGAPRWQLAVGLFLFPLMRRLLVRRLDITAEAVDAGWRRIDATLDEVEALLASGQRYLVGDRFTAADLTFASLMAPLILTQRYGIPLPTPDFLDAEPAARVRAMRERPAGQFALRLVAEHRPIPGWARAEG